ncbi:MAG: DUF4384 domain-containing protein, partial [Spirochaetales bacterium]|nr:DUF4384 domain-containing protein [Spirochaetales bacterium]
AESLVKKPVEKPIVVTIGNFVYADKGIGSELSGYIESQLSIAITESDYFELFAKNQLEEILEIQELSISDLCAGKDVRIGELASIEAIISGQFYDDGDDVLIFLSLIKVESGLISGTISFPLNKKYLPSSLSILPSNAENALTIIEDLTQVGRSIDNSLTIKAWPTRGIGGRYYKDEELIVKFQANTNCYIKIYHIDVNKEMSLIFPNKYHKTNKIKKDSIYTIPDESYGFAFVLGKPFGTEFIKIIASTTQFKDIEEAFASLGESDPEIIGKGLTIEQQEGKLAEVLFSYTIMETPGAKVETQ